MCRPTATIPATGACRSFSPGRATPPRRRPRRARGTEMGRAAAEHPILSAAAAGAKALARRKEDRPPLYEAIGRFLDEHRLEYSPANYLLAHTLLTRANLVAVAAIEEAT